jgi:hypothetical protein
MQHPWSIKFMGYILEYPPFINKKIKKLKKKKKKKKKKNPKKYINICLKEHVHGSWTSNKKRQVCLVVADRLVLFENIIFLQPLPFFY